jgi:parallel beta-helix repeat protein
VSKSLSGERRDGTQRNAHMQQTLADAQRKRPFKSGERLVTPKISLAEVYMRRIRAALPLLMSFVAACGGGGGGSGGGGMPPTQATTFYVRQSGDDANSGLSADAAFRTIDKATDDLGPGDTVYVGAGTYQADSGAVPRPIAAVDILDAGGTASQPIQIIADVTGVHTGDAGDVVIDGKGVALAMRVSRSSYVTIDGFRVVRGKGDNGGGIQIRNLSDHITVRDCVVTDNFDGVRVESSTDVLLFNNLIYDNSSRGIRISGSQRARIINNTIANNNDRGISIGGANAQGVGSTGAEVKNNIVQDNSNVSVAVDDGPPTSLTGYDGDYNLVFYAGLSDQTKTYRPTTIVGDHDVNVDAQFTGGEGVFALDQAGSPAVDAGSSAIGGDLAAALFDRSTALGGAVDMPPIDLGYHAP